MESLLESQFEVLVLINEDIVEKIPLVSAPVLLGILALRGQFLGP